MMWAAIACKLFVSWRSPTCIGLLPKIEMRQGADGILLIEAGGDYEASLLLADDIWSSGQIQRSTATRRRGPARGCVVWSTGSRTTAPASKNCGAIAAELAAGPLWAKAATLFVYRDGKFKVFGRK